MYVKLLCRKKNKQKLLYSYFERSDLAFDRFLFDFLVLASADARQCSAAIVVELDISDGIEWPSAWGDGVWVADDDDGDDEDDGGDDDDI